MKKNIVLSITLVYLGSIFSPSICSGQSPELSLREFASGQIKKGVRSIGMGGDGATWGNYSLVWRDSSTALIDGGGTSYSNNNVFSFTAVGVNTPNLWRGLSIYVIALSQFANNIATTVKSPGLGFGAVPVHGDGSNQALFIKAAMPLGNGFSVGMLLSYERSLFDAVSDLNPADNVRFQTRWLPSGGFGVTWQPTNRFLVGFRGLFNNDHEVRIDNAGTTEGLNSTYEYRLGISVGLWQGALFDLGGNLRYTSNEIYNTHHNQTEPNIGFEQNLLKRHLAVRIGLDETSETGGLSIRIRPVTIDVAYVHNIAIARFANLFGTNSNSLIATFVFNYYSLRKHNS